MSNVVMEHTNIDLDFQFGRNFDKKKGEFYYFFFFLYSLCLLLLLNFNFFYSHVGIHCCSFLYGVSQCFVMINWITITLYGYFLFDSCLNNTIFFSFVLDNNKKKLNQLFIKYEFLFIFL